MSASGEVSKQTGTFDSANGKVDEREAVNPEKQPTVSTTLDDGNGKTHESEDDKASNHAQTEENKGKSKGKDQNGRLSAPPSKSRDVSTGEEPVGDTQLIDKPATTARVRLRVPIAAEKMARDVIYTSLTGLRD